MAETSTSETDWRRTEKGFSLDLEDLEVVVFPGIAVW